MTRVITFMVLFFASPVWAAGSYGFEPSASILINEAKSLIEKEKYKRAISKLKKAKKDEPDNADIFNYLGFANRKNGDYEASQDAYQKALTLDPNHKLALEYQGELYLTLGDLPSAQGNLARLEQLCPNGCAELADLAAAIAKFNNGVGD